MNDDIMTDDDAINKPSENDVIAINRQQADNNADDDDRTQAVDRRLVTHSRFTHQC